MNKSQVKGFVIVAGIIVTFSLMNSQIEHPILSHFTGFVISNVVIAIIALIFGAIAGSIVGAVSSLIIEIFNNGFSVSTILFILLSGLYGFIIGILFGNKNIKADNKNAIGGISLFSFLSLGLYIVKGIFTLIIINRLIYPTFSYNVPLSEFIERNITSILINSLIIGVICFVLGLIYHKCLKQNNTAQIDSTSLVKQTFNIKGKIMVCEKCGQELKEGANFCTKCGTRFK